VLFDLADAYTKPLNAEKAYHYVIGLERWLTNEWSLRFETYYKDFTDLIVQKLKVPLLYSTNFRNES
jgi:TonB dependent receptor.